MKQNIKKRNGEKTEIHKNETQRHGGKNKKQYNRKSIKLILSKFEYFVQSIKQSKTMTKHQIIIEQFIFKTKNEINLWMIQCLKFYIKLWKKKKRAEINMILIKSFENINIKKNILCINIK